MKSLGRFVIRPRSDGKGDLILGAMNKSQGSLLKPSIVYEFREVLGCLMVEEIGPSAITLDKRELIGVCWNNDVNTIITCSGGLHLLTKAEVVQMKLAELKDG